MLLRHYLLAALGGSLVCSPAAAQTTHVVTVVGFTFSPSTLTIQAGDIVRWEGLANFHNVFETTPSSPAGFGSGPPGTSTTYEFTFEDAGEYTYVCEVHSPSMAGSITVLPTTGTEEGPGAAFRLDVTPNPFERAASLRLEVERSQPVRIVVLDLAGREVAVLHDGAVAAGAGLDLTWVPEPDVAAGVYLLRVEAESFSAFRRVTFAR